MEPTDLPDEIAGELREARKAQADGNDGKARVCGRRAVGKAFTSSRYSAAEARILSATECLRLIIGIEELPDEVRAAARRLSTSVADQSGQPISTNPVEDALIIIGPLLELRP